MTKAKIIQHIIDNSDIDLTECGLLTPKVDPSQVGPFPMSSGDIAAWDDDEFHADFISCTECHAEYMKGH